MENCPLSTLWLTLGDSKRCTGTKLLGSDQILGFLQITSFIMITFKKRVTKLWCLLHITVPMLDWAVHFSIPLCLHGHILCVGFGALLNWELTAINIENTISLERELLCTPCSGLLTFVCLYVLFHHKHCLLMWISLLLKIHLASLSMTNEDFWNSVFALHYTKHSLEWY